MRGQNVTVINLFSLVLVQLSISYINSLLFLCLNLSLHAS